ncbi:MAG: response regulator [Syntrophobacteraceae bacterium]|nr:response regulator [Syntrophobacteraceae bacterium]
MNKTILLVDDDEFMRFFAETMLTRFGYRVSSAEDGEAALEIYHRMKEHIDLVILDLIMPGMGGRKCLEELVLIDPAVKVIIASGYSPDWPDDENPESPAKGFIAKPYEVRRMLRAVREVLEAIHDGQP